MKSLICVILLGVFCVSCTQLKPEDVPGSGNMISGARYFFGLKSEGNLPGVPAADKGSMRTETIPLSGIQGPEDPLRMRIEYTPQFSKDSLYWYIIQRPDTNSNWNLVEAWRTDRKGQNKQELAVSR